MCDLKGRFKDTFYLTYLWYTALETDLLFFAVCDAMFLTQIKKLTIEQVSQVTFLSLVFSLLIQYPLLRFINKAGNRISVRLGSVVFMLSSICITIAPGYYMVLAGGFLKCIGHTLNSMGTATMRNHLARNHCADQFVSWQSDANSLASAVMMISSFLCGILFRKNAYYPMAACILLCFAGVIVSFLISHDDHSSEEILPAANMSFPRRCCGGTVEYRCSKKHTSVMGKYANSRNQASHSFGILVFVSFAIFTALSGTGLSYSRLNFQELLAGKESGSVISLLSIVSSLIYFFRLLSNVLMRNAGKKLRDKAPAIISALLTAGLLMQTFPWAVPCMHTAAVLCIGYLLQAFVRDPYTTLIANISLDNDDLYRQQSMLIALNGAKKAGTLLLAAACTLILKSGSIFYVMAIMTALSCLNIILVAKPGAAPAHDS